MIRRRRPWPKRPVAPTNWSVRSRASETRSVRSGSLASGSTVPLVPKLVSSVVGLWPNAAGEAIDAKASVARRTGTVARRAVRRIMAVGLIGGDARPWSNHRANRARVPETGVAARCRGANCHWTGVRSFATANGDWF